MEKTVSQAGLGPAAKRSVALLLLFLLALLAGGALSVPFIYESQTLWYKVGADKVLLRCGQLLGLVAAVAIVVQMLLGVRGALLQGVFGAARLTRWHRWNGLFLVFWAILHVSLILSTEEPASLFALQSWPELVGGLLLLVILSMVASALLRPQLGLIYSRWRLMHRLLAYPVPLLLAIHVLFVSDSFAQGPPMAGLIAVLLALLCAVLRIKWVTRRQGKA